MTVSYGDLSGATPTANLPGKPRLRGWLHLVMAPLVQVLGLALLVVTPTVLGRTGLAVYLVSASILFGTSAAYHLGNWSEGRRGVLRRLDHANIFLFIAGTYTPLSLMLLDGAGRVTMLTLIWAVAAIGIAVKTLWMAAPRWFSTMLYVLMGWAAVGWLPQFWRVGGPAVVILIGLGGLIYSYGALVYARKRPNPSPTWFGFHEIFHTCTVLAALCHFGAIALVVLR